MRDSEPIEIAIEGATATKGAGGRASAEQPASEIEGRREMKSKERKEADPELERS